MEKQVSDGFCADNGIMVIYLPNWCNIFTIHSWAIKLYLFEKKSSGEFTQLTDTPSNFGKWPPFWFQVNFEMSL